jgi:beta-mannanase
MSSESVSLTDLAKVGGSKEGAIRTWLKAVKAYGKPFFLRWNWEMNGTWFPWGKKAAESPEAFVSAWRRFHDLAEEEGATNITWVWCPNVVFSGSTELAKLYPGNKYVDWTCMDGYNRGTNPIDPLAVHPGPGWITFYEIFQSTYSSLLSLAEKPVMIAETSSTEYGGSKSGWIEQAISRDLPQIFPSVNAFVWFNWNIFDEGVKVSGRWDWPIESSASAEASFATSIGSTYYANGSFKTLPSLESIQPLP